LSIENSTLECRVEELEQELGFYKDQSIKDPESSHPSSEPEKIAELSVANKKLLNQIKAYEDEIFELSEQISVMEADTGPEAKVEVISKRLSTMVQQRPHLRRPPVSGRRKA
jgi:cell division septum initiation protein DivIVA